MEPRFSQWFEHARPESARRILVKLFGPYERRRIVEREGLRLYIDPYSYFGRAWLGEGYEADTFMAFDRLVSPGDVVVDIGANEGVFTCHAARLCKPGGLVIAVEPQRSLTDILRINVALNPGAQVIVVPSAVDMISGKTVDISLSPLNTGASSIVNRYRWSFRTTPATTVTPMDLLALSGRPRFDLVKIDVEGYEYEVVNAMRPLLDSGSVGCVMVDFHRDILKKRDIEPQKIHEVLTGSGYLPDSDPASMAGYVIYRRGVHHDG